MQLPTAIVHPTDSPPQAGQEVAPAPFEHDYVFLRACRLDGRSFSEHSNGFRWPTEPGSVVEAPDWDPNPQRACGGGLHGLALGIGDWALIPSPSDPKVRWYVCGARRDETVDSGDKVRVRRCRVLYVGHFAGAMAEIAPQLSAGTLALVRERCAAAEPEGQSATGYRGAASATGDSGAASATGDRGAASATGYRGAASATGYSGAASATGDRGAASATGDSGAASATGDSGAASATGDSGAASATGYSGAASATGDRGAASATGKAGVALAAGIECHGMVADGCLLVLVERHPKTRAIAHYFAAKAGERGVEAGKWYTLRGGELVEVTS